MARIISARSLAVTLVTTVGVLGTLHTGARPTAAQTQTCEHTISLPGTQAATHTISAPGVYCLETDVVMGASFTSGAAIEIAANNVILDLNGHQIRGLAAPGPDLDTRGIHAVQRRNVTIKNGTVRGFHGGVQLEDQRPWTTSSGHRVEGTHVVENAAFGIEADGTGSLVRGNQVIATGTDKGIGAVGIVAGGPGVRILDNDVTDMIGASGANVVAVSVVGADGAVVEQNRLGNRTVMVNAHGIDVDGTHALVVGNRILRQAIGVAVQGSNSARCRDNIFSSVTTHLIGCADVANNN